MELIKNFNTTSENNDLKSGCSGSGTGGCTVDGKFDSELNHTVFALIQNQIFHQSCVKN